MIIRLKKEKKNPIKLLTKKCRVGETGIHCMSRVGKIGIGEKGVGKMGLGETGPNRSIYAHRQKFSQ